MSKSSRFDVDAIIVGAGLTGMYLLWKLRKLGLSVRVIEKNGDVGGTWNMNRYPGCKLDSESYTYAYSFLPDLLQEWEWQREFAGQPELMEFFSRAADKMDVRKDITFNAAVSKAIFDEADNALARYPIPICRNIPAWICFAARPTTAISGRMSAMAMAARRSISRARRWL